MAYEKVTDLSTDTVVKLGGVNSKTGKPNPLTMEGYYLGNRSVKSDNGTSVIHIFQTPKGNQGVWGTADINTKLGQIKPGTMVLVEYVEKRKLAAGKTKHVYSVSFDKDNTIEVASSATVSYDDGNDEGGSADTETTGDFAEEDQAQAEELAALEAAEAARQAASKARVQALLNKNKAK